MSASYLRKFARPFIQVLTLFLITALFSGLQAPMNAAAAPQERPRADIPPSVSVSAPVESFIGQDITFTVQFDNTDTVPGYGPLLDLILPTNGADGAQNTDTMDGLTFVSATYLGADVESTVLTFPGSGGVTCVDHPYMVDSTGSPVQVCGNAGDTFVALRLPFGSFTPDQPAVDISVTASMSNLADLGTPLTIQARGGYQFGYTPLDDWCCGDDPTLSLSGWTSDSVTPIVFTLSKSYSGPEDETATGPNFPRQYTVTAEIAPGQTMSSFTLSDVLPDNMQFTSVISTSPGGASCSLPSTSTPGGTLSCDFGAVSGTVSMTFEYFIPLRDSGAASVIDPVSGDDALSCNNASGSGNWTPVDGRDTGGVQTINLPGCEHILTDKSIAIQKGVAVVGGGQPAPGAVLEYTIDFQISDFFAFDQVVVTDTFSDGQRWDATFTPTLQIVGNPASLNSSGSFNAANYTVDTSQIGNSGPNPPPDGTDGTTTVTFRISDEMFTRSANSRLIGGCVPSGGTGGSDPDCGGYNDGPTTGRIVFRTVMQDQFSDTYPSGDPSVDQGDTLNNDVSVIGNLLATSDATTPTGQSEADGSSASVSIGRGQLTKAIYAINGSTTFGTPVEVKPGDTVTYRLTYTLPTGDVEDLRFDDYLPLPVFHVGDPDEDGVPGPAWTFNPIVDTTAPAAGVAKFGPSDTFYAYSGIVPSLTSNTANNRLDFLYGDFDGLTEQTYTVDLLFTVTVSDDPFADRLQLTNQAHAYEGSTNAGTSDANAIVQIILTEPVLVHKKGAVATTNPNAVFDPATVGPVTFNAPGTAGVRWAGIIDSPGLAANPIDSDISGVDAGDLVTFAIVIENLGSSDKGAFDITITDTMPSIYQVPAGGLNLRIANGDNSSTFAYTRPDNSPAVDTDLFGAGIRIVDPDPDNGACQSHTVGGGKNIIVITYDLEVRPDVIPGTEENTATLTNYAGTEGGDNHIPPAPPTDTASTTVVASLAKELVATEINNATNDDSEVVIGEIITYRLTSTVPEGDVPNAFVTDHLDSGLAFLSCTSVTASSADVTTDLPGETVEFDSVCATTETSGVTNNGQDIRFDLGNITNANRDNATPETITIVYQVVVLNVIGNQGGTLLDNAAEFLMNDGGGDTTLGSASAPDVTVIEPVVTTDKTASPATTDAGNTVTFQVTFSNTSDTEAFDITWTDTVPAEMTYVASSLVTGACPATTFTVSDAGSPTLTAYISDLDVGETCTLTFDADVLYSVTPGYVITNSVETRWTSLQGAVNDRSTYNTESDERTGEDGLPGPGVVDDYRGTDSATVTINQVAPDKYLVATSEPFTGFVSGYDRVTVGEIIRYRLVVRIPEGTSPNFQIRDNLPSGLLFLNDNTSYAFFVSNGGITSTGIDIVPGISDPDCQVVGSSADATNPPLPPACDPLADNNVGSSNSTTVNADTYTSGTDVYFKLGTLQNNDSDSDAEYVVVEFNALVHNYSGTSSNDAGERLRNNFSVFIGGSQANGNSNNVDAYVVEPSLTLVKTPAIDPSQDAGDTVTYTLTITAASGTNQATAFDLVLTDALDTNLSPVSAVITSSTQTSPCVGNGGGTTAFTSSISLVGQNVTLNASCLDPGQNIVATVTATVINSVVVPSTIPNVAYLTWTSLPGSNGTTSNPTGSQVTGAPGTEAGERTGSGVAPNDYTTSSSGPVVLASPAVDKHDPSPTEYTIGQTVTYDIWVTLPEGVTQSLVVTDNIPSGTNPGDGRTRGLKYVSYSVLTSDPSLAADYNGTLPAPAFSCAGTCSTGDDITLTFGDVATAADNITNNNTFIVRVTLLVENVSGNQDIITPNADYPTTLTNQATITYTGGSSSNTAAAITVIEPRITTTKSVNPTTSVQAGDTVTYTVRFTNTGHSTAYEVTAHDTLAQGVVYNALVYCRDQGGTDVPTTVTDNGSSLDFDGNPAGSWDIAVGNWIECQYTAIAQTSLYMDGGHTNTVDADWSSLEGSQPDERVYNDTTTYNFDGTQDTATATFNTDAPTLVKDDGGVTQVVIGDTITFTLTIGGDLGTYRDVVIADLLPAGLIYNNDAVITGFASTPAPVVSSPNDGTAPVTITWTFGDVYKNLADATITYSARVADVVGNEIGDVLTNNVTLDHDHPDGTQATQLTDTEQSTVAEAIIATTKAVNPTTGVEAGDVVTYTVRFTNTGTSTAYEVTALDTLAQGMGYNAGSAACVYNYTGIGSGAIAVLVTDGGTTLTFTGNPADAWDIPATNPDSYIECQYTATALPGIFLDGLHTNTIDADWTSQNGSQPNERNYDDSVSRPGVDGTQDTDDASFTTEGATISKSDGGVTQVVIGQTVHITLTITVPLGTLQDARVVDTLPAGLIYVTGSQTVNGITPGPGAGGFSVSAPNDGSVPVVLTWDFADAQVTSSPVVIEYDAVVANVAGNVDGTNLINEVHLYYTDTSGSPQDQQDSDDVTVVESELNVDKTHATFAVQPDAGDEVHYIVTIAPTAASHATAYDVHFTDLLPAEVTLDLVGHSIVVTLNGDAVGANTSGTSGNLVDVVINAIPNTPGTNVVIEYWATLNSSVTPSQLIENTGNIAWTSTSGVNPNERTGSGSGPNDYSDSDTDSFNIHDPAFSKSVYPGGSSSEFAIGETVTFSLNVTLPEGTTPSLRIVDDLPAGLQYISGSEVVDTTGFNGSVPAPTVTLLPDPPGSGTDVQFDFSNITVTADGNDANNTFSVRFQAVVLNEAGNQQSPPPLVNSATMTVSATDYTDTESISIIEPVLSIAKTASDLHPGPNQVVTFTLTVQHSASSHADAYDVLIYDDLPAELTLNLASVTVTLGGSAAGVTNNSSGNRVEVLVDSLPNDGSTVTIQFQASVSPSVVLNQVITNGGNVNWTSTPGPNPDERTGSGTNPNDYFTNSTIDLVVQKSLSKNTVGHNHGATLLPEVAIGEIITYQVDFNVPVGVTTGVTITDVLDLGLAYMDCVTITATSGITTSTPGGFASVCSSPTVSPVGDPFNLSNAGRQVVFNFGDLENTSGAVGLITIQYRAVVLDIIENQETVNLNNSVTLNWSAGPLQTASPQPLVIVESDLLLEKTADVSIAVPGTIITFTLTVEHSSLSSADAYDVLLEDIVPAGLDYLPGTLTYVSGIAPTTLDDTAAPTLQVRWDDFPLLPGSSVIQFQAQMQNIPPGSGVSNRARVEWSSLPGDISLPQSVHNIYSTERRYDPLSAVDIYGVSANATITVPALPSTGFAPGRVTEIPVQAAEQAYSNLGDLWLEIPRLGVKMPIVGIPARGSEWDLTWLWEQAGWLSGTAYPTTNGNSVITGHVYLPNGQPGPFIGLGKLKWGDQVVVHMNGLAYTYEVRNVERVTPNNLSAYRHEDLSWVTLVTCQGYNASTNTYAYRLVVRAVLMSIEADVSDPNNSH